MRSLAAPVAPFPLSGVVVVCLFVSVIPSGVQLVCELCFSGTSAVLNSETYTSSFRARRCMYHTSSFSFEAPSVSRFVNMGPHGYFGLES